MDYKQLSREMYIAGMSVKDIAEELGITVSATYAHLDVKQLTSELTKQKYEEAVRLYRDTDTPVHTICSQLHMSPPTLYAHVREQGLSRRNSGRRLSNNPDIEQDIVELYKLGMIVMDIKTMYGIDTPKIYDTLRKYGVSPNRQVSVW